MGVDEGATVAGNGEMVLTGPDLDQGNIAQPRWASCRRKPQLGGNVVGTSRIAGPQIIIDGQYARAARPTERFGQHAHTIEAGVRIPPVQPKTTPHQTLRRRRESCSRRHAPSP